MITAETVATALLSGEKRIDIGDDWFSNGYFAVRGKEWTKLGVDKKGPVHARWVALKRTPVAESLELRIPSGRHKERCDCIDGVCECECGNEHKCAACDGDGTVDITDDVGQIVFFGEGGYTVVNPILGALLEGLTVVRAGDDPAAAAMLLGLDDCGEPIVAVMPMREKVRDPNAVRP